jgi:hypothetical protein
MRFLPVIVLLLLGIGVAVFLTWGGGGGVPLPPGTGNPRGENPGGQYDPEVGGPESGTTTSQDNGPRRMQLPPGVIATRTEPPDIEAEGLADEVTACLQVLDYRTQQPIASAIVRSMHNGADLAFTDERGLASVALAEPAQLAVVYENYLLRLAPVQLGSTEQEPQVVQLVPDRWSLRRGFAFVDPDGKAVTDVLVRLRPANKAQATRLPVPAGDAVLRRAWTEHTMLATRAVSRDVAVQLGKYSTDRVHHLTGKVAVIRFVAPGDYVMEAATTNGLVARNEISVIPGSEPPAQRIMMIGGAWIGGRVTDLAGKALADAQVSVQGSEPLGLRSTTGQDGTFTIGPLLNGAITLLARHGLHAPIAFGPVLAPAQDVQIKLRALQRTPLRGRVRSRPDHQPIALATIIWQVPNGAAITAKTAADGTFELRAAGDVAAKLLVQAPGYTTYAELVDPGAAFANYDVWPATTAARLNKGVTATLEGVVFGKNGFPIANASVRWTPQVRTNHIGMPGRRILAGATLYLPGVATSDSSGAFVLETNQFGSGVVSLQRDASKTVNATAIAGQSKNGLELRQ